MTIPMVTKIPANDGTFDFCHREDDGPSCFARLPPGVYFSGKSVPKTASDAGAT